MVAQNIVAVPYAAPRPGEAAVMGSGVGSRIVAKGWANFSGDCWACAVYWRPPRNAMGTRYCLSRRSTGEYEVYKQGVLRIKGPRKAEKRVEW
jgi:hypothetical protein